jgi:hypothetical protein
MVWKKLETCSVDELPFTITFHPGSLQEVVVLLTQHLVHTHELSQPFVAIPDIIFFQEGVKLLQRFCVICCKVSPAHALHLRNDDSAPETVVGFN